MRARPLEQGSYWLVNHEWRVTDSADVNHLADGKRIQLNRAHAYRDSKGRWHEAPKGFICDGASIPRFAWSIAGHPFGVFLMDAIIHDWLYSQLRFVSRHNLSYERADADRIFRDGMTWRARNVLGNRWRYRLKAATYYRAVRMFGGLFSR